jgi:hypothetical protein
MKREQDEYARVCLPIDFFEDVRLLTAQTMIANFLEAHV